MPDLTPITIKTCPSNLHWGTTINDHCVFYGKQTGGRFAYGWSCDCLGYQYRRNCKHIEEAKGMRCGWNAEMSETDERNCPECGEPLQPVEVMV